MSTGADDQPTNSRVFSTVGFAERHDLIPELTPFDDRNVNPWETVRRMHDGIEALPQTSSTFEFKDLYDGDDGVKDREYGSTIHLGMTLMGAWPMNQSRRSSPRWVNPNYPHERALAPADVDREEHVHDCLRVGVIEQSDLARRFDIKTESVELWCRRNNIGWADARRAGKRRLARTIAVACEWCGYSLPDLTALLPVSYNTVRHWTVWAVRDSEWSVPDDPTRSGGVDS